MDSEKVPPLTYYGEVAYALSNTKGEIVGAYGDFTIPLLGRLEKALWDSRDCFDCGFGVYLIKCHSSGSNEELRLITEVSGYYQKGTKEAISNSSSPPSNIVDSEVKH